jgi:hypothetical protein
MTVNDSSDACADLAARFSKANKENDFIGQLGDLYVNLLRCSRSPEVHYRVDAAESLIALVRTINDLNPETPLPEVMDKASQRVGWQERPSSEKHELLNNIARAGITYLIEASGHNERRLLTKRTDELVRAIDAFNEYREEKKLRRH